MISEEAHYLGFDFSTQQLKGVIINDSLEVVHQSSVNFDGELPEFRTQNGVHKGADRSVTTPVLLWVKALDLLLDKLSLAGADFSKVAALSGGAQQHGTVYWTVGAEDVLKSLDPSHFLHTQVASLFSVSSSPVWLDSTTSEQCRQLTEAIGSPEELARVTGSRAYERYSAAQIAKIYQTKPTAYKSTERISLISSFACSLILGEYAAIDWTDASGTNLFNITKKEWHRPCLNAVAPGLEIKLGEAVPSNTILGSVSPYLVERFGFPEECKVIAFTGDNAASIAGLGARSSDIVVSLGTSDTVCVRLTCNSETTPQRVNEEVYGRERQELPRGSGIKADDTKEDSGRETDSEDALSDRASPDRELNDIGYDGDFGDHSTDNNLSSQQTISSQPPLLLEGHVLVDPIEPMNCYMALVCFKNGSLTRERIRNLHANSSWENFSVLLDSTPAGNNGYFGLYLDQAEIIPRGLEGEYRYNSAGQLLATFPDSATEVRALLEGQMVARRAATMHLPLHNSDQELRLLATGGASVNQSILKVMSDVFKAPVYTIEVENSAALGSAYRARHAALNKVGDGAVSFEDMVSHKTVSEGQVAAAKPRLQNAEIYDVMIERYKEVINTLTEKAS